MDRLKSASQGKVFISSM